VLTAGFLGFAAWGWHRRPAPVPARASVSEAPDQPRCADTPLSMANQHAAARLWSLAFAGPPSSQPSAEVDSQVRANITAMLEVDSLDPQYFPRRPALMPQLLQAIDDPEAAAARVSRIIAHDPVLTAEILRLANSSHLCVAPIDTIQRAIVVCGAEVLRGMLATAMLRPVFRASRKNFPRVPRMLWHRTERATRAAEQYALQVRPGDRFEAQMAVLLRALGPLAVYGATLDVYGRNPQVGPNPALCSELLVTRAAKASVRIAHDWQMTPRLIAALEGAADEPLSQVLLVGELFGTAASLQSYRSVTSDELQEFLAAAQLPPAQTAALWQSLHRIGGPRG